MKSGKSSAAESSASDLTASEASANFEEVALPLFECVRNFARKLARNETDAEDLVQEAYLKAFRNFCTFEPGSNFRAWIFRILKNTYLTSRNSAQYRYTVFFDLDGELAESPSHSLDPVSILIDKARLDAVQSATHRLPTIFRDVLVLCDIEGVSYREAAHVLAIPVGTVMSRLARARRAVRESSQNVHHTVARAYGLATAKAE